MTVKLWIFILLLVSIATACGKKDRIYENFCKRFYENATRSRKEGDPEILLPPHKTPPSYEQYQRDRRAMLNVSQKNNIEFPGKFQSATVDDPNLVSFPIKSNKIDESLME